MKFTVRIEPQAKKVSGPSIQVSAFPDGSELAQSIAQATEKSLVAAVKKPSEMIIFAPSADAAVGHALVILRRELGLL